jgi:hypothetical protein
MEHRQNIRREVDFKVALRYRGRIFSDCRARNISLGGMLIDTGSNRLPKNALIEIELSLDINRQAERRRILASVVHANDDGIGVMFIEDLQLYPFPDLDGLIQAA